MHKENKFDQEFKPQLKKKKYWKWILLLLLFLVVIFLIYLLYIYGLFNIMVNKKTSPVQDAKNLIYPGNLQGEETGDVNLLFIGMRSKDMNEAYSSSAMMIINLDIENNKMNLISIPRDLWVPIDGKFGKANSIYKTAAENTDKYPENGLPFVKKTFSDVLAIDINYIFVCDFNSFEKIIDRIGKINVAMSEDEAKRYPFLSEDLFKNTRDKTEPTIYHFDGEQSFVFVSWPKNAVPDFDRLRRMQLYLFSFTKDYIRASSILDPSKTKDVLNIAGNNIKMDMQFWEIVKITNIANKIKLNSVKQYKLTTNTDTDGGLLRESQYDHTTYNPIAGDSDFSQIQEWAEAIINN